MKKYRGINYKDFRRRRNRVHFQLAETMTEEGAKKKINKKEILWTKKIIKKK
jgi:hypothetical protein